MPRSRRVCWALGLLLLTAGSVSAKVANPDWKSLFQSATAIGVVQVERVESYGGVRVALATVLEPVAGLKRGQRIAYIAQPGWFWTCDASHATPGERALLLLAPIGHRERRRDISRLKTEVKQRAAARVPLMAIAWSGWGRLQAARRGDQWWITERAFLDPPAEFKRGRRGAAVPLAAVREFTARVRVKRVTR